LKRHRLVTLVFSHYNEKARWALDYCGIDYEERRLMPGFSQLGVMLATRGRGGRADKVSGKFSTPVLITRDGEQLCDSTDIARWASGQTKGDPLFPSAEVVDVVEHYGRHYGPHTRLAAYWHALRSKTALPKMAKANVGPAQAIAFRALSPLGSAFIKNRLGVTDERYERSLAKIREEIANTDRRLERSKYLVGDTFTAADLTFAALSAPVLLVSRAEGYGAELPSVDDFPNDTRALVAEVRATRAGAFALEVFRKHRQRPN
jgi:glutathione S-transferase